ncbi:MAG: hypothetical protein RLZZ46_915 [Bacteroidota bacterium]|jgi:lipopolysaccharide/colanic/teichoic acid biosynthesis glycosyltransferase
MKEIILDLEASEVGRFLRKFVDINSRSTFILRSENPDLLDNHEEKFKAVILIPRINDIRYVNRLIIGLSSKIEVGSLFLGCFETYSARSHSIEKNSPSVLWPFIKLLDFVIHRVFPKTPILKEAYFSITKGRNRLLSKAEVLGRLVFCGFEIVEYTEIDNKIFFVVKKGLSGVKSVKPSYGLLYSMPRTGKNGKTIMVYKFRTMHPYSEFLHDYVLTKHGYSTTGKPANDFRLTPWGRFFRKYWLDEIPQLLNILKGEMKLVGIRPVGERYLKDIPEDLVKLRLKHKPGCIPPYVALNRNSDLKSVQQAEREYLIEKTKRPYTTDLRYFFKALFVILIRKKRSA